MRNWQKRIFITAWITYASLYLGRVNIAVALPALQDSFGWTRAQAGLIGSAFFWLYALGQLINGLLGDRWNPRRFVAAGLLVSASMNLAFGFSNRLIFLILIWGLNGYVQSTGWGPIMRVLSHWFALRERGRITALFSPCYVLGHVASWLLAGWLVAKMGWRPAFWIPGGLLLLSTWHWWMRIRNTPTDVGLLPRNQQNSLASHDDKTKCDTGFAPLQVISSLFTHPQLPLAAVACLILGVVKDSFAFWAPTYLIETQGFDITRAAGYAIWLPLLGAVGIAVSGWVSHRFFRSEEAPVVAALLGGLTLAVALYRPFVSRLGGIGIPLSLGLIGAMGYGANGMLLTALPLTQSGQGRVSSAAGFLDFASYVGAGLGGICTGILADRWGWDAAFGFWTVLASIGMTTMLLLSWRNHTGGGSYASSRHRHQH